MSEPARVIWLIYSRGLQYRRTKQGYAQPPMREDEHAYRVVLPMGARGDRTVVRLDAERVSP